MKRLPARWNLAKTTKSEKREILKKISEELNSPNPKTPDMKDDFWRVIMLAMDENNKDCASLIKNTAISSVILRKALLHPNWLFREAAAGSRQMDNNLFVLALTDDALNVRYAAANNPLLPRSLQEKCLQDIDPELSDPVSRNIFLNEIL